MMKNTQVIMAEIDPISTLELVETARVGVVQVMADEPTTGGTFVALHGLVRMFRAAKTKCGVAWLRFKSLITSCIPIVPNDPMLGIITKKVITTGQAARLLDLNGNLPPHLATLEIIP